MIRGMTDMTETGCCRHTGKSRRFAPRAAGFTLVEFAVVMMISGLIMASAIHAYKVYLMDKYQRTVYERLDVLNSSFSIFAGTARRYPCPSDSSLPVDDDNAGVENCAAAWALLPGTCTASGGICRVDGAHNTPALGLTTLDPVFIGGIPYKTIRAGAADPSLKLASLTETLDPWGFQLTYAVSASQTDSITFNSSYGVIDIRTEAGISLIQPAGTAHFVIVSHGENHKGAYNQQGQISFPCTGGTADFENCNRNNATFIAGLRNMGAGANYFDDVILQRSFVMTELWKFSGTNVMFNANPGNVGLGITTPSQKLDINGNIMATTLRSNLLCDRGGVNCWNPEKIGGSGMNCGPPSGPGKVRIMRGIRAGEVEPLCFEVDLPAVMSDQRCLNPGEYVVGFTAGGNIICEVP